MAPRLSKSKYLSGLQCRKRLWIETCQPELIKSDGQGASRVMRLGSQVGTLARTYFPDGVIIRGRGRSRLQRTRKAIREGATCLFEAAFVHEHVFVLCDVLLKLDDGNWALYEVKSSTQVKPYHIHDVAVQKHVLQGVGVRVSQVHLMVVNSRTCRHPNLSNLFRTVDVTARVEAICADVERELDSMRAMLAGQMPAVAIGTHCMEPFRCPVRSHCWRDVPTPSIFSIPRLSRDKADALAKRGLLRLDQIPNNFPLTPSQWSYVRRAITGRAEIHIGRIRKQLDRLQFPLYFLDFETYSHPIPQFPGLAPYAQYPFQYSCHVLYADGRLEHREYLHTTTTDPRLPVATSLVRDLDRTGTIVVYNAAFERRVVQELAQEFSQMCTALQRIERRLWDQLDIFRNDYLDPRFEGSSSIKKVLPVLAPDLSYAELAVQNGQQAQIVWEQLLATTAPEQKLRLAKELREYCALDTLAMVEIHAALCKLVASE